jgi:hypothetical protein
VIYINWREHKKQLLKDPEFREEYEALDTEYKLASELIRYAWQRD